MKIDKFSVADIRIVGLIYRPLFKVATLLKTTNERPRLLFYSRRVCKKFYHSINIWYIANLPRKLILSYKVVNLYVCANLLNGWIDRFPTFK